MIWTEEQKTEMQRMRNVGISNNDIGAKFNTSGDNIRKVLARRAAREAGDKADSLRQRHFAEGRRLAASMADATPDSTASRPQWAGRPPLRITPKDFQKERS